MATVHVSIGHVGSPSLHGSVQVFARNVRSEVISSSGTAASGAIAAQSGQIAQIVCATAVMASANGAASAVNGVYVPATVPTYLALSAGDTVSVIDVS